jgi:hypothetical protein
MPPKKRIDKSPTKKENKVLESEVNYYKLNYRWIKLLYKQDI